MRAQGFKTVEALEWAATTRAIVQGDLIKLGTAKGRYVGRSGAGVTWIIWGDDPNGANFEKMRYRFNQTH